VIKSPTWRRRYGQRNSGYENGRNTQSLAKKPVAGKYGGQSAITVS
jgi:hypothetical protein